MVLESEQGFRRKLKIMLAAAGTIERLVSRMLGALEAEDVLEAWEGLGRMLMVML